MKKSLVALAGLAVLATPAAYASKARMSALGQGTDFSYYIKDQRSTFKNTAHYNTYNNFVITEWGGDSSSSAGVTAPTTDRAEGGFARQSGSFVYGVYLGDDRDGTGNGLAGYSRSTVAGASRVASNSFMNENNNLELNFAGDAGIKWGASLNYSSAETNNGTNTADSSTMGIRGGVMADMWEAYLQVGLTNDADGSTTAGTTTIANRDDTYEGDTSFRVGGAYNWNDWTFFADYFTDGADIKDNASSVTRNWEGTSMTLGAGHTMKLDDKATMFMDISYVSTSEEFQTIAATTNREENDDNLKVNIAFEAMANSWLTLRGSVSQNVLIDSDESVTGAVTTEDEGNSTTTVAAGATLTWGKLMLDGTIAGSSTDGNLDLGADTLSTVALSYYF